MLHAGVLSIVFPPIFVFILNKAGELAWEKALATFA